MVKRKLLKYYVQIVKYGQILQCHWSSVACSIISLCELHPRRSLPLDPAGGRLSGGSPDPDSALNVQTRWRRRSAGGQCQGVEAVSKWNRIDERSRTSLSDCYSHAAPCRSDARQNGAPQHVCCAAGRFGHRQSSNDHISAFSNRLSDPLPVWF